jgi:hypothetical protein
MRCYGKPRMQDLHAETVVFLYSLLKKQQSRLARSAHQPSFPTEQNVFSSLQSRLLLELRYGENASGNP